MAKTQRLTSTPGVYELSEAPTIGDIKRFLARLIQRVDRGRVSIKKGNCLAQIANVLINAIVDHELEARIAELEQEKPSRSSSPSTTMNIRVGGGSA